MKDLEADGLKPAVRRESTDERRLAIATAAREIIVEKGFEGLRTRDIADRVGINVATLHYHVPTKEALIEMVAKTIHDQFHEQGRRRPRQHLPPYRQLEMEFEDARETLVKAPDLIVVFSEMLDRARRDGKIADVITPLHSYWTSQIEHILTAGKADGIFRADLDAPAAARMITGAIADFWRRSPKDFDCFDRLTAELMRAIANPAKD